MQDQLHIGNLPIGLIWSGRMKEARITDITLNKPTGENLLWTSTAHENRGKYSSAWTRFCNDGYGYRIKERDWYLLTPHKNAKIAHIITMDDFLQLSKQYPLQVYLGGLSLEYIDYVAMSYDYDAVHVTQKVIQESKQYILDFFNLYDVESTFWFRWKFSGFRVLKKKEKAL